MSRELKFRAYIKHLNMLVDVDVIDFLEEEIEVFITGSDMHVYRFDEIELIKYTGLKDKNGREIYEGDILQHNVQDYVAGYPRESNYIAKVIHGVGAFWAEDMLLIDAIENDSENEVIGNIYENPELLEDA